MARTTVCEIWMQPDKLGKLGLTPSDVISAINEQNIQAPAGKIGGAPTPTDQQFTYTISAPGRLISAEEFENIIVRQTASGAVVRIKDIGHAELGSQDYNSFGEAERQARRCDGRLSPARSKPAQGRRGDLRDHGTLPRASVPTDLDYKIVYDTTPAVEASIEAILQTFVEALILVTIVVFVFLQNIRATIIPLITVPVSLDRNVHLLSSARLLAQHPLDVRPRAGHRHRGG